MATTLLAVEIGAGKPVWTSVGDSPLWHWSRKTKTARQVNERHNPPERPSTLLSCLTGEPIPIIGNGTMEDTEPGDLLIAASDGLDTLTKEALERGKHDHRPSRAASASTASPVTPNFSSRCTFRSGSIVCLWLPGLGEGVKVLTCTIFRIVA